MLDAAPSSIVWEALPQRKSDPTPVRQFAQDDIIGVGDGLVTFELVHFLISVLAITHPVCLGTLRAYKTARIPLFGHCRSPKYGTECTL